MLSQYLYISTAPDLSREDVDAIVDTCARNNPARAVTGLLLYNGRNFMQLIEGEQADLISLMARIGEDDRHAGISILYSGGIEQRACPDWAMKRIAIAESIALRRQQLEADLPAGLKDQVRDTILNFAILN